MIFPAEGFSKFEYCPRLPQLERTFQPPRIPVREAAKLYLESGIRSIMARSGTESTVQTFLEEAASPGYIYPDGEPYVIAQDHASWLDGSLRLIAEEFQPMEQLPLFRIGEHYVSVEGWQDAERVHIFRASSSFGSRELKWPEMCIAGMDGREICIHNFRLPGAKNGRIFSPLVMAFQHPSFTNINYRLAKIDGDKDFKKSWKHIARWEIQPNPSWEEWRRGITKDRCIDSVREAYTISPTLDTDERKRLLFDIEAMCEAQNRPSIYPRYREKCANCIYSGLCHGDSESRSLYEPVGKEEIARFEKALDERR